MAEDQKLSQKTSITVPLTGNEIVFFVQGGVTRKGKISDFFTLNELTAIGAITETSITFDKAALAIFDNALGDKVGLIGATANFGMVLTAVDIDLNFEPLGIKGSQVVIVGESTLLSIPGAVTGSALKLGAEITLPNGDKARTIQAVPPTGEDFRDDFTDSTDTVLTASFQQILQGTVTNNYAANTSHFEYAFSCTEGSNSKSTKIEYFLSKNGADPGPSEHFTATIPQGGQVLTVSGSDVLQIAINATDTVEIFVKAIDTGAGRTTTVKGTVISTKLSLVQSLLLISEAPASQFSVRNGEIGEWINVKEISGFPTYNFGNDITETDPTTGIIKFNSSTPASVTKLFISDVNESGIDISGLIAELKPGDFFTIGEYFNAANFIFAQLISEPINNGTWFTLNVSINGSGGLITDGSDTRIAVSNTHGSVDEFAFSRNGILNNNAFLFFGSLQTTPTVGPSPRYETVLTDITWSEGDGDAGTLEIFSNGAKVGEAVKTATQKGTSKIIPTSTILSTGNISVKWVADSAPDMLSNPSIVVYARKKYG